MVRKHHAKKTSEASAQRGHPKQRPLRHAPGLFFCQKLIDAHNQESHCIY